MATANKTASNRGHVYADFEGVLLRFHNALALIEDAAQTLESVIPAETAGALNRGVELLDIVYDDLDRAIARLAAQGAEALVFPSVLRAPNGAQAPSSPE